MTSSSLGLESGTVRVVPYDDAWPALFAAEAARIGAVLAGRPHPLPLELEHVGSTAVPGLVAKPILDVAVGRPALGALDPYVEAIAAAGYTYRGEHGIPGRHYFVRGAADGRRTHHLHLVVLGGALWRAHSAFRDYLRRVPERAAAYAALKESLASRFPADRAAYTDAKAAFIEETVRMALDAPDA